MNDKKSVIEVTIGTMTVRYSVKRDDIISKDVDQYDIFDAIGTILSNIGDIEVEAEYCKNAKGTDV